MLDSVLAGIVVLDAMGRVERANPAACRILEQLPSGAAGRPVEALLGEGDALRIGHSSGLLAPIAQVRTTDPSNPEGNAPVGGSGSTWVAAALQS